MPRTSVDLTGVIARDAHIQLDLRAFGYGRERINLEPTPANLAHVARLRQTIMGEIERGTFVLAKHFPDSPRVKKDSNSLTFLQLAQEWHKTRANDVQHSTLLEYAKAFNGKHFKDWHQLHLPELDFRALKDKLAALPANPKTFNNLSNVLAMILEYGHKAKLLKEPLHTEIEARKPPKATPDPFTLDEVNVILSKIPEPRGLNYYEFAFFSGLRPSEQIALDWNEVDLRSGTVLVKAAITRNQEKGTKTGEERKVELTSRALAALKRQRPISQVAGGKVFIGQDTDATGRKNPSRSAGPLASTDNPLDMWWKPAMRLSGVRYRDARQTRHTFATLGLHAGLKPGWIAAQMGHSTEMFYRVYSKWMDAQDKGAERRKLDAYLSGQAPGQTGT